ncbi:hypothetical protein FACS1894208_11990 [Clostridia bacterium]|nr:hypothetical protein FACS1894208_11990 [Clostridia bacterium]
MDSMAEFLFYANFDTDNAHFGDDYWGSNWSGANWDTYDPGYYSRLAAQCDRCGAEYENLCQAVSETAKCARRDGWQIEKTEKGSYKWYCPKCKAAHDFEGVAI